MTGSKKSQGFIYVFLLKELDYEQSMLFGEVRRTRKKVSEKRVVGVPLGTLCKLTSIFHEFFFWFVELHRKAGPTCSLSEHISPCERSPVECVKVKRKRCRTFRFLSSSLHWRLVGHNLDHETTTYLSFPFHWKSKSSLYQKVSSYNEFSQHTNRSFDSFLWLCFPLMLDSSLVTSAPYDFQMDFDVVLKNIRELNILAGEGCSDVSRTKDGARLKVRNFCRTYNKEDNVGLFVD